MTIFRAQTMALYLLVLSALGTVFSAEAFEWPLVAGIFTATCASLVVPFRLRVSWSQSRIVMLGLVLILGGVLLEVVNGHRDIISGATLFLVLVLVSRLFTKRSPSDAVQILTLSFVVVLAGSALNTSFAFAPYFLLVIVCSIWALTTTHLTRAAEAAPELARDLRISRGFWITTSLLAVVVFVMTSLFFVLFPRMGLGYFKPKIRTSQSVSGFNDRVQLGQTGTLESNATVVARLEFDELTGAFNPEQLYFRGVTLSRFDGKQWLKASPGPRGVHFRADGTFLLQKKGQKLDQHFRLYQEPGESEYLFLPEITHTGRLLQDNPFVAGHQRVRVYADESGDVTLIRPVGTAISIEGWFDSKGNTRDDEDPEALVVPATDARIGELAKQWRGDAADADTIAERLSANFNNGFTYSTEMKAPPEGTSPIAFFLFDRKAGHCEYYASALALMLRLSGVPARIISGYRGADYNEYGKYYAIHEYSAHSWVEYRAGGVWKRIDPTPPTRTHDAESVFSRISAMSDVLAYRWNRYVIEYDLDLQISALRSIKKAVATPKTEPGESVSLYTRAKAYKFHAMGLVAIALMIVLARRRRVVHVPKQVEASRLLRRFERLMEKRGHEPRPLYQPHKIYFARLVAEDPPVATATDQFAQAYLHARFSGEVSTEDVMTMRAMLERVSKLPKPVRNNDVRASAG